MLVHETLRMERNALEDKLAKTRIPLRHRSEVEELKNKAKGFVLQAKRSSQEGVARKINEQVQEARSPTNAPRTSSPLTRGIFKAAVLCGSPVNCDHEHFHVAKADGYTVTPGTLIHNKTKTNAGASTSNPFDDNNASSADGPDDKLNDTASQMSAEVIVDPNEESAIAGITIGLTTLSAATRAVASRT